MTVRQRKRFKLLINKLNVIDLDDAFISFEEKPNQYEWQKLNITKARENLAERKHDNATVRKIILEELDSLTHEIVLLT